MIYFVLAVSVLGQADQIGGVLELTGEAAKVEFGGGALTLIHDSTEDELVCSGSIRASDVRIAGTSSSVLDLLATVSILRTTFGFATYAVPGRSSIAIAVQSSVPTDTPMSHRPPAQGLRAGFLDLVSSLWRSTAGTDGCTSPYIDWEQVNRSTGEVQSIVAVCFNNSFQEWVDDHIGGDISIGTSDSCDGSVSRNPARLRAIWRIAMPSAGLFYMARGINRAIMLNTSMIDCKNGEQVEYAGIHYKRTPNGEHFPWWHGDGNVWDGAGNPSLLSGTQNTYLCKDSSVCGYEVPGCGDGTCDDMLYHRIVVRPAHEPPVLELPTGIPI